MELPMEVLELVVVAKAVLSDLGWAEWATDEQGTADYRALIDKHYPKLKAALEPFHEHHRIVSPLDTRDLAIPIQLAGALRFLGYAQLCLDNVKSAGNGGLVGLLALDLVQQAVTLDARIRAVQQAAERTEAKGGQ